MKRVLLATLMIVLIAVPSMAFKPPGDEYSFSSGQQTADAAIVSGTGFLYGIIAVTDGTNAATVVVYDNTAASGTKLVPDWPVTTSATDRIQYLPINPPVTFQDGVYVDITSAGTFKYVVLYRMK